MAVDGEQEAAMGSMLGCEHWWGAHARVEASHRTPSSACVHGWHRGSAPDVDAPVDASRQAGAKLAHEKCARKLAGGAAEARRVASRMHGGVSSSAARPDRQRSSAVIKRNCR